MTSRDRDMAKRLKNMIWQILITIVSAYALLTLLMFLLQGCMVYHPSSELMTSPDKAKMDYEDVDLHTSDGLKLHAWFVHAKSPRGTVLMFHGNAGNISHRIDTIEVFHRLGYNAMIVDYRGYGRSEGSPGEQGTYLDALAAWQHLTQTRKIPGDRIVLFGRSLGGAVATWLAAELDAAEGPAALIVESTFTSIPDRGAELYPFLPVRWLARIRYNTLERIATVPCRILIIHSRGDEIIPFHHGKKLYDAASEPKDFLEISGGHNEGFIVSGAVYTDGLAKFLESAIPRKD